MKITYSDWMTKLNQVLAEAGQTTRIVEFGKQRLVLSNGTVLYDNEFTRFKKRMLNPITDIWIKNIDYLLAGQITEKQLKAQLCSASGKACQALHSTKIKENLNTGIPWNKDLKGKYPYSNAHTDETKRKISEKNSGQSNGMYGTKMSAADKADLSALMQERILAGTFTPKSNNRNTHWDAVFDNKKFRSSWEALYQYFNPGAEYEKLRIRYVYQNKEYIYIVDFVDHDQRQVIEVKPIELCTGDKFHAKISALTTWANHYGYKVILATKDWFLGNKEPPDYNKFDTNTARKIKGIYETGKKN